ncbi:MAG: hypothetical protein R3B68_16055 [Phycisphaerales bacterium]
MRFAHQHDVARTPAARAVLAGPTMGLAAIACLAGVALPAAAQVEVTIENFDFTPATVTIQRGETVRWTNRDFIQHTATSQTGPGTLTPSNVFGSPFLEFNET